MALDFPASPTVGQSFTAAGVTWTWDGTKWAASGLSVAYLPLTGGTLSGSLALNAASGTARNLNGETNGSFRWNMQLGNATAESGTAGGSDFALSRFDNTGAYIDSPLTILRGNGVLVAADGVSAPQAIGDNRIINGDMRIKQRAAASGTAQGYTVDRWGYLNNTAAARGTWSQGTAGAALVALGWGYNLGFTSSSAYTPAAGDAVYFYQSVEADLVSDFAWGTASAQPVTLSFWVLSTLTGTFGGSVTSYQQLRSYPFSYSIPFANNWYKIVINIPGDTTGSWVMSGNSGALTVYFDLGTGANLRGPAGAWAAGALTSANGCVNVVATNGAQLLVTGVKLEIGNVATPYNRQSTAKSLADCQRYYAQNSDLYLWAYQNASSSVGATMFLPMTMRAAPTVVIAGITSSNIGSVATSHVTPNAYFISGIASATGTASINFNVTANSEL